MSRIKYRQVVRDAQGDATADALITVRNAAGTLATIYDAASGGSALGNGTTFVSGDGDPEKVGAFEFWIDAADQGLFSITVGSGASADTFPVAITEQPAANFTSRSALVTAWSDELYTDGTIVSDGTVFYKSEAGATIIADLTGLVPFCPVGGCSASPEHFQEHTTPGTTDMTAGIQAAIDYCGGSTFGTGTFGQGATVGLLARDYLVADDDADDIALIVANSVSLKGQGENSTRIVINSATDVTIYVGKGNTAILADTAGTAKVSGVLIQDLQMFNTVTSAPTAGSHIRADRSVVHIDRCHLINHYRAVEFLGSPEGCKLTSCQITQGSNNGATGFAAQAYSAGVAVMRRQINATFGATAGYQDSGDSLYYIEPNSVYITNNNIRVGALTTQNGGDYAILVGAVDGLYATNNHFAWGTTACVGLVPEQANISFTNVSITGGLIDPLPGKSQYGVQVNDRLSVSTSVMGSIVLNGIALAGCVLDGVNLAMQCRRFQINGGEIKNCGRYGVSITSLSVTDTIIDGVHIFDTDNVSQATDAAIYLESGQRTTVSNCLINETGRGIQVFSAAQRTSIIGNKFEAINDGRSIYLQTGAKLAACSGNDIEETATVASGAAMDLPVGADKFYITGTTNINNINATGAPPYDGRRITLVFAGSLNVTNNGNIASGGTLAVTANDVLELVYDETAAKWLKVALSAN